MTNHSRVSALQAATGLPILWCRRWIESGPAELVDRLLAGENCRHAIRDLDSQGLPVPCPVCGAGFRVVGASGYCSNVDCRDFCWTGTTIGDRDSFDDALRGTSD